MSIKSLINSMFKQHEFITRYCSRCFGLLEDIYLKKNKTKQNTKVINRTNVSSSSNTNKKQYKKKTNQLFTVILYHTAIGKQTA